MGIYKKKKGYGEEFLNKFIYGVLIVIMMGLIFFFSSQGYDHSMKTSGIIVEPIEKITEKGFSYKMEDREKIKSREKEKKPIIQINKTKIVFFVRKSAHMFNFAILFILVYLFLNEFKFCKMDTIILALIFCFIYGCSDEIHQIFVSGRTAQFYDVCVDMVGANFGLVILWASGKISKLFKLN